MILERKVTQDYIELAHGKDKYYALKMHIDALMRYPRMVANEFRKQGEAIIKEHGWDQY